MPKAGKDSKADYKKYRDYYLDREASAEGVEKRVDRARARSLAIKSGMLNGKNDPREVDHKRSLDKGGKGTASNIQVLSRTANRRKYNH